MATSKSPDTEDLNKQIETLRSDIASITDTLGQMAKAQKDGLTNAAHQRFDDARARGADAISQAQAQANALNAQAHDFVQEKPAVSLGMAAALGFVVGIITTSRR